MSGSRLSGRIAVVTGAGKGIGRACAIMLAENGARVAAVSRTANDLEVLASDYRDCIFPYPTDVSDYEQVGRLFDEIKSDIGSVSILVASAGCYRAGAALDMSMSDWNDQISGNLTTVYLTNLCAIRAMLTNGGGDIVNILSIAATMPLPGGAVYAASKAAALSLSRSLSAEYRKQGIRITALMPGATNTTLWDNAGADLDRGRMITSDAVAEAVLYAVSQPQSASVDELVIMPRDGFL